MAMGTVFSKEGIKKIRSSSSLRTKRVSFQRMKEGLLNTTRAQNHLAIETSTMNSLYQMKQARRARDLFRKRFFALLRLVILVALVLWILV